MKICSFDVGEGNLAYTIMNCKLIYDKNGKRKKKKYLNLCESNIIDFDLIDLVNPSRKPINETCVARLKTGSRKGQLCGCIGFGQEKLCGKHGGVKPKLTKKKSIGKNKLCENIKKILDKKLEIDNVNVILIETQPVKYKKMSEVSHYLFAYCVCRTYGKKILVRYLSARGRMYFICNLFKNKLEFKPCTVYNNRKDNSIKLCIYMLDNYFNNNENFQLKSLRKKDDVADCIMQTIWYLCKYQKVNLLDTENMAK